MFNISKYSKSLNEEIKAQRIFGLWSLEERDGRTTKVPYNATTNRRAKSNDSQTWTTFDNAVSGLKKYKRTGIAIFLGNGICGLDVDHIKSEIDAYKANPNDENNLINKIKRMTSDSYMEVSQSGEGIHVIFKALSKNFKNAFEHENGYELYYQKRFFALTGNLLTADESKTPEFKFLNDEQVQNLIENTVGFRPKKAKAQTNFKESNLSEDEIINIILRSKQAEKFKALFTHDISYCQNHYESHSEADLALCSILAFYTRDANKIDAIFRKSKLCTPKWLDKKAHDAQGHTYAEMTINKAIEGLSTVYEPNRDCKLDISFTETKPKMKVIVDDKIVPINGSTAPALDAEIEQKDDWTKHFIYNKTKLGEAPEIKSTSVKNAFLIINNDAELKDIFKYNEFTQNVEVSIDKSIDLRKYGSGVIKFHKENLRDIDITNLGLYIESSSKYKVTFKTQLLYDAVEASARQHSYNPIIDYMNECKKKWDGKHRLDDFFPIFLGAERSNTTNLITRLWFMGGVAKAYNPKAKFDYVLDLVGGQGTGKTTLLHRIAPLGLYTDQFTSFTDKDDLANMKDAFIVNDDEMDASNKSGFAEVKKFITLQTFKYRKPYGRATEEYAKHFIIARTTNEKAHLRDRSGDRRFMTILVNQKKQEKFPYTDLNEDYVKQIWGEAVHLYESSEDPFALSESDEKLLKENREQFIQTTALEDKLNETIASDFANNDFIIPSDLAYSMFNDEDYFIRHRKEASEINYYMEHLGYVKKVKKINGKPKKVFFYIGE